MRISLRFIRELLPALTASATEVADRLNGAGIEVAGIESPGVALAPVIVAAVTRIDPHPKHSGLKLVTVDRGGTEQTVVCGADNVPAPGGRVVLAPVGTTLPGAGFTLEPRKIGGVPSDGMLSSEAELGLADAAEGILVLDDPALRAGTRFIDAFPEADDTVLEIELTPNRPDGLGHVGIARELAALFQLDFSLPSAAPVSRLANAKLADLVEVENRDLERCPRYGAAVALDVSVKPSPAFMRWRLHRLGVRPISNVVDITNWLLLLFAQPMHAFDLDRVRGGQIVVRRAKDGEPFTTLDGIERTLEPDDLVICDGEGPTALAGVMGGLDSEIRETTRRVLLECAHFAPRGVRRAARRHGLHTESSHRFERGTDWANIELVLDYALGLLHELAGAAVVPGQLHRGAKLTLPTVKLRSQRLNQLLGIEVPFDEATGILQRLGLHVEQASAGETGPEALVRGASWRPDILLEADLIEEVARVRGLDRIPTVLPAIAPQLPRTAGKLEREATELAVALGLSEAVTYSFVSEADLVRVKAPKPVVRLSNPLSEERHVLRTSLLPGLLETLGRAQRRGEKTLRLFSVGSRFLSPVGAANNPVSAARPHAPEDLGVLPEERPSLAVVLAGPRPAYLELNPDDVDVFDAKGYALELAERLTGRTANVRLATPDEPITHLHPRGAATVLVDSVVVGHFGPLHPAVVDAFDLETGAQIIEIDLGQVELIGRRTPRFSPIPRLPGVTRDLSLVVHDDVPAGKVSELVREIAGELCESVEIVSEFRGGSVANEHRSLTLRVVYRDPLAKSDPDRARTLTDKEVDQQQSKVLSAAQNQFGATLRG